MAWRLNLAWFALAVAPVLWLTPVLTGGVALHGQSDRFLREQDIWLLAGLSAAIFVCPLMWGPARRLARRAIWPLSARATLIGAAALVALIGWIGASLVFGGYPLSRDETLAGFGAAMISHGQAWAPVAPEWRAYAAALEPEFVRFTAGATLWQPAYLPVNAALRAIGGAVGLAALVNPVLAAISVVAVYAVARRLWPARPNLALTAAILLATSSQLLVTAMTPYAMTAHLAFNLAWLWLYLRGGRSGHTGALAVGFLATGLHQIAFHPLFAAPFVLQLWSERRWRLALTYTLAYAGICLFWLDYASLTLTLSGGAAPAATVGGIGGFGGQVAALIGGQRPPTVRTMAENLIRFMVWQNFLLAPLAALGCVAAVRAGGTLRALVAGIVLTTAAMCLLMPYQGHGWGYRYWQGLLGSFVLVATFGWGRLVDRLADADRGAAGVLFAGAATACLLVEFPIEATMAHDFARPYASAWAAIRAAPSQLVFVDPRGGWYVDDLVRNDPYLVDHPLVLREQTLTLAQIRTLCGRYTVSIFDAGDAADFGVRAAPTRVGAGGLSRWRRLGLPLSCGPNGVPVVEVTPWLPRRGSS